MALALASLRSEFGAPERRRFRVARQGALAATVGALALLLAPGARAASIGIDPLLTVLTCVAPACDSLTVQLNLGLGEIDVDSFSFDIDVDNAALIGLAVGPVPGNPIAGINGTLDLLADGTTLRGLLNSLPNSFDGLGTFDIATIPLQAIASGTAEFRFLSAEIACTTCNFGAGAFYPVTNQEDELLAQVVVNPVPEPGTFSLLALGIAGLGAARRKKSDAARASARRGEQ